MQNFTEEQLETAANRAYVSGWKGEDAPKPIGLGVGMMQHWQKGKADKQRGKSELPYPRAEVVRLGPAGRRKTRKSKKTKKAGKRKSRKYSRRH